MKNIVLITFLLFICVISVSAQAKSFPSFEDYKVSVYTGKIHLPEWINYVGGNEWRDQLGKLVEPPNVNFAGKFFIATHSCGTGCRYYTLTDLSTGRESNALDIFATPEERPKTKDGYEYSTLLYSLDNSKMLIAHYIIDLENGKSKCRQRDFLFDKNKLKAISKTKDVACEN